MSQVRKALKIVSLVQVLVVIWALATGVSLIVSTTAEPTWDVYLLAIDHATYVRIVGVLLVGAGVFTLLSTIYGIRGANRPSALGSHPLVTAIGLLAGFAALVLGIGAGIWVLTCLCVALVALDAASFLLGRKVREELDR